MNEKKIWVKIPKEMYGLMLDIVSNEEEFMYDDMTEFITEALRDKIHKLMPILLESRKAR